MSETIREFVLAAHSDLEKVKSLYAEHPELLEVPFDWGAQGGLETPLQAAAHVGNRPIAEFLLAQGAQNIHVAAAMLGDETSFNKFLEENPALVNQNGAHGISLLFHAGLGGNLAILERIYRDAEKPDLRGALMAAVMAGNLAAAAWAVENNAPTEGKDWRGKTIYEIAEEGGNAEIIALLEKTKG